MGETVIPPMVLPFWPLEEVDNKSHNGIFVPRLPFLQSAGIWTSAGSMFGIPNSAIRNGSS